MASEGGVASNRPPRPARAEDRAPSALQVQGAEAAVEVAPGAVFTTVFRVLNTGAEERTVTPELGDALGWPSVMPLRPFAVPGQSQSVQIVSVQVPADAAPGTYEVRYGAIDREDPAAFGVGTTTVAVPAVVGLALEEEEAPRLAVAGTPYEVRLLLVNTGNTAVTAVLDAVSNVGVPVRVDADRVRLRPGELRRLTVTAAPGGEAGERLRHVVRVDARVEGAADVAARLATSTDLVSPAGEVSASARALRGEVAARGVQTDGRVGGQLDASGAVPLWGGTLDGAVTLADRVRTSAYPDRSRASLRYTADGLAVAAGDHVFALSPLTEPGRYGFGAGAEAEVGAVTGGAFAYRQRYGFDGDTFGGGFLGVRVRPGAEVRANALHRRGRRSGDAVTLQTVLSQGRAAALDAECGLGTSGAGGAARACSAQLAVDHPTLSVHANVVAADPGFPGRHHDVRAASGSAVLRPAGGVRVEAALQDHRWGETLGGLATRSYRGGVGVGGRPAQVGVYRRGQRLDVGALGRREDATQLAGSARLGRVGLRGTAETGRVRVGAEEGSFQRVQGRARVALASGASAHVGVEHRRGQALYPGAGQNGWRADLGAALGLADRTRLSLSASASLDGGGAGRRYVFAQAQADHTFASGHRVEARGRLLATSGAVGTRLGEYSVAYVVPLAVPVRRGLSGATVRGRVYDAETGAGLANVAVRLGDRTALTDGDGVFVLPRPTDGTSYLTIDQVSAGIDRVPLVEMPLAVPGGAEAVPDVEIPLLRGARLTGELRVVAGGAEPAAGVRRAVLEMESAGRRLRTVAGRDGRFAFEGVAPGAWTLRVLHADLPRHHAVERDAYAVALAPGEAGHLEIGVRPLRRQIRLVETGVVSVASGPSAPAPPRPGLGQPPAEGGAAERETTGGGADAHTVEPGDTLFSLARRYGTTVEALLQLNGLRSPDIRAGDRLRLR